MKFWILLQNSIQNLHFWMLLQSTCPPGFLQNLWGIYAQTRSRKNTLAWHYWAAISIQTFGKQNKKEKLMAPFGLPGLVPTVASFWELWKHDRKSSQQPAAKFGKHSLEN